MKYKSICLPHLKLLFCDESFESKLTQYSKLVLISKPTGMEYKKPFTRGYNTFFAVGVFSQLLIFATRKALFHPLSVVCHSKSTYCHLKFNCRNLLYIRSRFHVRKAIFKATFTLKYPTLTLAKHFSLANKLHELY